MIRTTTRTYRPRLISEKKALRCLVPVLLAITVLTVVASAPAVARTPRIKKPGAPTGVLTSPISGGASVSWTPPASDGGAPITGYTVTASHGGAACSTGGTTTCTVTGLIDGRPYTVHVKATNVIGPGTRSAQVGVTPSLSSDCSDIDPYANLAGCNLANANLAGANLTNANLNNTIFTGATLTNANLTGANLTNANLSTSGLSGADLADTNLTLANLENANLTGANLTIADLTGSYLYEANLADTDLTNTDVNSSLQDASSGGITGTPSVLPTGFSLVGGYLIGPDADLYLANLTGLDLSNADLAGANLYAATLSYANLTDADMSSASLALASLDTANLTGANLHEASLAFADLNAANLTDADLSDAYLAETNLGGTNVSGANLDTGIYLVRSGQITGTPSVLPSDEMLVDGYLVGPGADLGGANLSGANLTGVSLASAVLNGTDLIGANLTGIDMTDANLDVADLSDANLSGITWSNTTCPDDTNSNNDGFTCVNNLALG
jgi:uncharacterized protein YjbI with pentapeptide repeats